MSPLYPHPPEHPPLDLCRRLLAGLVGLALLAPAPAWAETFAISSEADLRNALTTAQSGDTISFGANVTLTTGDLPIIQKNISILGNDHTLSGNNQFRGLFIAAFQPGTGTLVPIDVTVSNLTIANAKARGGDGGSGGGSPGSGIEAGVSGGGAGLGGALFIAVGAQVTARNLSIVGSNATGGSSGKASSSSGAGGGGGMGGNGGDFAGSGGGGGGLGSGANGGNGGGGSSVDGRPGIALGAASGADGGGGFGECPEPPPNGCEFAPGGKGGVAGGGGGGGSFPLEGAARGGGGGPGSTFDNGGFGGGGAWPAGKGGFGGGAGGGSLTQISSAPPSYGANGGEGGFGGGGGGGARVHLSFLTLPPGRGGIGGFGGGSGGNAGVSGPGQGGGGAGMGGAVFVMQGGSLTLAGPLTVNGNTVAPGLGGPGAQNGQAFGSGFFMQGDGVLMFAPAGGQSQTVSDVIADQTGSGGTGANAGSWGLVKSGAGTLVLGNPGNLFTGGIAVTGGTLGVAADGALGIGSTVVLGDGTTLALGAGGFYTHALTLAGNPTITVPAGQTATFNGQIADDATVGTLSVAGGGTLALTNRANSYSGGSIVAGGSTLSIDADAELGAAKGGLTLGGATSGGTLRLTNVSAFFSARPVTLNPGGGTIDTEGAAPATLSGAISGTGGFVKTGTGTLTLSGVNTYSGATTVDAGALALGPGGSIAASSGLSLAASGSVFDISGGGSQTIRDLSGVAGSMIALGTNTLTAGAANSTTFAGAISGTGGLSKTGTGTLTLSGNSGAFAGTTSITGGMLEVGDANSPTAKLGGDVTVGPVGALAGHGTIGGSVSNTSGVVVPGGSIGTLMIGGNFTQGSAGTLVVEVSPTVASQLVVGGKASSRGYTGARLRPGHLLGEVLHLGASGECLRKFFGGDWAGADARADPIGDDRPDGCTVDLGRGDGADQ